MHLSINPMVMVILTYCSSRRLDRLQQFLQSKSHIQHLLLEVDCHLDTLPTLVAVIPVAYRYTAVENQGHMNVSRIYCGRQAIRKQEYLHQSPRGLRLARKSDALSGQEVFEEG